MSNPTPPAPTAPKPVRLSPGLIGAGVLVVALGFGLPMLSPSSPAPEAPTAPAPATAAKPQQPAPISPPSATGLGWSLVKLAVGLVVVCGLCVLLARYAGTKPLPPPSGMEVLAAITVGRGVVHLVRIGERRLLLGTDASGVKALVELPGADPLSAGAASEDSVPAAVAPTPPAPMGLPSQAEILNLLLRLRGRADAPPPG